MSRRNIRKQPIARASKALSSPRDAEVFEKCIVRSRKSEHNCKVSYTQMSWAKDELDRYSCGVVDELERETASKKGRTGQKYLL